MKKYKVYYKNLAYIAVEAESAQDASINADDILQEKGVSALTLDGDWDECLIEEDHVEEVTDENE